MVVNVNGEIRTVQHDDELLVWVLRDELGLTGTHFGCGIGICGSCSVLVDGMPTRACLTPVAAVAGKSITTVEGLASELPSGDIRLHAVQQAFVEHPLQCGWCLPGHMLTAVALIAKDTQPTDDKIDASANANYCRCGGYNTIRAAVKRAAEIAREITK
jgi:aerobic-type carbon monoxide dehydrogenase small subunit (CoxS/CutS family)